MEAPFKEKPFHIPIPKHLPCTQEEHDAIDRAEEEYFRTGAITETCPRCGGKIVFHGTGTSYSIECERKNCLKCTVRGL